MWIYRFAVWILLGGTAAAWSQTAIHPAYGERTSEREAMVANQLGEIADARVLAAMRWIPRHAFIPEPLAPLAYGDHPLPIGHDQTISQPLVVAMMSELLDVQPSHRVLELGTGSGYQAAILGELAAQVFSVEIVPELSERAVKMFAELGCENVHVKTGDGFYGWSEHAPYERIIITFAVAEAPPPVLEQLATGGKLVMPAGDKDLQWLTVIEKDGFRRIRERKLTPVRFVPMLGDGAENGSSPAPSRISLPPPDREGTIPFERILGERRSARAFRKDSLTIAELAQLLWAAQGITSSDGFRTAPSAGATFPLEVFAIVKRVTGIRAGVYRYLPAFSPGDHALEEVTVGDPMPQLALAAAQSAAEQCLLAIAIVTITERTAHRYGGRAQRYVTLEAGHAAQNVLLQAEALNLGAVPVGAFDDGALRDLLETSADPLYLIPVGRRLK